MSNNNSTIAKVCCSLAGCALASIIVTGLMMSMGTNLDEERVNQLVQKHISEIQEQIVPEVVVNVIVDPEQVSVESNSENVTLNTVPNSRRSYGTKYQKSSETKIKVWSWNGGSQVKTDQLRQTVNAVQERMSIVPSNHEGIIDLILETAAVESHRGQWTKQISGPACGLFQMEPATAKCLLSWLKNNHNSVYKEVVFFMNKKQTLTQNLTSNVPFQIAMTTAHYWRYLGDAMANVSDDQLNRAMIWKAHYNTRLGKGDVGKYLVDAETYL